MGLPAAQRAGTRRGASPALGLRKRKRTATPHFYIGPMTLLLINLLVLAVVTAANLFAYARVLRIEQAEETLAPAVDYAALQARWQRERQASDWASLQAQVRQWQARGAPDLFPVDTDEAARALNDAVFRFAVPGERPAFLSVAAREPRSCPATRRVRALG
jgi:hypothetical protein